jgi:hypothetical protein
MSLLRKSGMTAGGCLFTVGLIALFIFFGIFRLITGHLPEYGQYMVWAFIAISIFGEAYIDIHNAIDESTSEIKEEINRLERKIEEEIRKLELK